MSILYTVGGETKGKGCAQSYRLSVAEVGRSPTIFSLHYTWFLGVKRVLFTLWCLLDLQARQTSQGNWYSLMWGESRAIRFQNCLVFVSSLCFLACLCSAYELGRISFLRKVVGEGVAHGPAAAFFILMPKEEPNCAYWLSQQAGQIEEGVGEKERQEKERGYIRRKGNRRAWYKEKTVEEGMGWSRIDGVAWTKGHSLSCNLLYPWKLLSIESARWSND